MVKTGSQCLVIQAFSQRRWCQKLGAAVTTGSRRHEPDNSRERICSIHSCLTMDCKPCSISFAQQFIKLNGVTQLIWFGLSFVSVTLKVSTNKILWIWIIQWIHKSMFPDVEFTSSQQVNQLVAIPRKIIHFFSQCWCKCWCDQGLLGNPSNIADRQTSLEPRGYEAKKTTKKTTRCKNYMDPN